MLNKISSSVCAVLLTFYFSVSIAGAMFPEDEAGISAYMNVGQNIDIDKAQKAYRIVEYSNKEYIVGLVSLPNLPATEDVHVYISRDGWIVAYYLKDEVTSKMLQLDSPSGTTKLADAISIISSSLGVGYSNIKYYDFRYPTANKVTIMPKTNLPEPYGYWGRSGFFEFSIPSNYIIYETTWSLWSLHSCTEATINIDGTVMGTAAYGSTRDNGKYQGYLSSDVLYKVKFAGSCEYFGGGAIIITYQQPEDAMGKRITFKNVDDVQNFNLEIPEFAKSYIQTTSQPTTTPPTSGSPDRTPSSPPKSASVSLTGEKTDVVLGEDILLKLSAVNLITKPMMHVQVIIIPPSGMSVTSTEFSKSGTNQFTANYELEPGDGKDIEVRIRPNQIGDFNVNGRIIYYFGDEKDKAEDHTLNLPIKVRKEISSTPTQNPTATPAQKSIPGFEVITGIIGLLFTTRLKMR